eukprot:950412-Pelagomonas_calceolata.AAC.2
MEGKLTNSLAPGVLLRRLLSTFIAKVRLPESQARATASNPPNPIDFFLLFPLVKVRHGASALEAKSPAVRRCSIPNLSCICVLVSSSTRPQTTSVLLACATLQQLYCTRLVVTGET